MTNHSNHSKRAPTSPAERQAICRARKNAAGKILVRVYADSPEIAARIKHYAQKLNG